MGRKVTLKLRSRVGYVDLVHEIAEDLARGACFPKPAALNIGLAVREAFINAIKHGNNMNASKMVEVQFEQNAEHFRIRVRDQGPGFDWTQMADPSKGDNVFRTSGRGIFFMKHFVDHVAFQRCRGRGTEVLLEKKLGPGSRGGRVLKRRKG